MQTSGTDLGGSGIHGNNSSIATLSGLVPNASGTIVLNVSNVHDTGIYPANSFGYLGVLSITDQPAVRVDFGIAGTPANGDPTASPDTNGNYWNNVTSTAVATNISGGTGLSLSTTYPLFFGSTITGPSASAAASASAIVVAVATSASALLMYACIFMIAPQRVVEPLMIASTSSLSIISTTASQPSA